MTTVLLLGAGGSAGANVIDALRLSPHGYRVVGIDISPVRLHLSLADERVVGCRPSDPSYADGLRRVVESRGVEIVHPQPDPEVLAIGALREELGARTFLPAQATLETAADKVAFAARMAGAGVPVPESAGYADMETVTAQTEAMLRDHERVWVEPAPGPAPAPRCRSAAVSRRRRGSVGGSPRRG